MLQGNFVLLTYDSCRYDVLMDADTPVLDSFASVVRAQTPANFTYAAHQAFFVGMLPNAVQDLPYYNRFCRQLIALADVGELHVIADASVRIGSNWNIVAGMQAAGVQTVGAGAMNWFRQESLRFGFDLFRFTGTDARAQIEFVLDNLEPERPFFAFINFGETHSPYAYEGKRGACPIDVRARLMRWPPAESGLVGRENEAYAHQVEAAEFLDRRLARLLSELPPATTVVLCADHGECFGEDGYWGHGVNHRCVHEVPLAIFRLDGASLG
jgi:hypothetical protein